METVVKKWGNSAAVRIPASIMEAAKFTLEQHIDVRAEGGRIVIEPRQQQHYDLAELLAGINRKNIHLPVETGAPQGREAL